MASLFSLHPGQTLYNMMKDVERLLHAARLLLDAMELGLMPKPVFVVIHETFLILFEVASLLGVTLESLIENTLYSGVVFLPAQTP